MAVSSIRSPALRVGGAPDLEQWRLGTCSSSPQALNSGRPPHRSPVAARGCNHDTPARSSPAVGVGGRRRRCVEGGHGPTGEQGRSKPIFFPHGVQSDAERARSESQLARVARDEVPTTALPLGSRKASAQLHRHSGSCGHVEFPDQALRPPVEVRATAERAGCFKTARPKPWRGGGETGGPPLSCQRNRRQAVPLASRYSSHSIRMRHAASERAPCLLAFVPSLCSAIPRFCAASGRSTSSGPCIRDSADGIHERSQLGSNEVDHAHPLPVLLHEQVMRSRQAGDAR